MGGPSSSVDTLDSETQSGVVFLGDAGKKADDKTAIGKIDAGKIDADRSLKNGAEVKDKKTAAAAVVIPKPRLSRTAPPYAPIAPITGRHPYLCHVGVTAPPPQPPLSES